MKDKEKMKEKTKMRNITINLPYLYDRNIQWLISNKLIANRSEAVRIALKEFLDREFGENLDLLGFSEIEKNEKIT